MKKVFEDEVLRNDMINKRLGACTEFYLGKMYGFSYAGL